MPRLEDAAKHRTIICYSTKGMSCCENKEKKILDVKKLKRSRNGALTEGYLVYSLGDPATCYGTTAETKKDYLLDV